MEYLAQRVLDESSKRESHSVRSTQIRHFFLRETGAAVYLRQMGGLHYDLRPLECFWHFEHLLALSSLFLDLHHLIGILVV